MVLWINAGKRMSDWARAFIRYTKKADWVGDRFKEREVANAIRTEVAGYSVDVNDIVELAKNQREYQ